MERSGWSAPGGTAMKQIASLAWKEWHEVQWFFWVALFTFIGLPCIGACEAIIAHTMRDFRPLASPWVYGLGSVLAVLVAEEAPDLHLETFDQSRRARPSADGGPRGGRATATWRAGGARRLRVVRRTHAGARPGPPRADVQSPVARDVRDVPADEPRRNRGASRTAAADATGTRR